MKPLIIYQANCADGFGAAFAAWLKFGDKAEYLPMQYLKPFDWFDPRKLADREVYILNFSFPRPIMDDAFHIAKRVVWLDHHKTAFEMWCPQGERKLYKVTNMGESDPFKHHILLDNDKSGALLAWEYFHPNIEVPMLIKHIDDYDRCIFAIEGTKEFNMALWSYAPWTFDQWWRLFYDKKSTGTDKRSDLLREGSAIIRAHNQNVKSVVEGGAAECIISTGHLTTILYLASPPIARLASHRTSDINLLIDLVLLVCVGISTALLLYAYDLGATGITMFLLSLAVLVEAGTVMLLVFHPIFKH